jgi:hypothetical protein
MKKQFITGPSMPTAQICINKSRLKVYNKESFPTYYLTKGQEFQIELFNPTSDTVLAKIYLNNKAISQGGLVIRPGERVFLERYLDIAKKFLFDTYEVANTAEVQKAIEDNGDFKVEFFREQRPHYLYNGITVSTQPLITTLNSSGGWTGDYTSAGLPRTFNLRSSSSTIGLASMGDMSTSTYTANLNIGQQLNGVTTDGMLSDNFESRVAERNRKNTLKESLLKSKKTIETGRVEAGSQSSQEIKTVSKSFEYFPFHTTEYKLSPVSQKVNTSEDINVKRYCHNCGAKQKPEFKFCPSCGAKC